VTEIIGEKSISGVAAQALIFPITKRAGISGFGISGAYIVTDVGIAAGELFEGVVDRLQVISSKYGVVWEAQRDELTAVIQGLCNDEEAASMIYDVLPTTIEAQGFYFWFPQEMDLRTLGDVSIALYLRAATDEWGAASAFTGTVRLSVKYGPVARSYGLLRVPSPSLTVHDLDLGEYPIADIFAMLGTGPTAGTTNTDVFQVAGSDGKADVDIRDLTPLGVMFYRKAQLASVEPPSSTRLRTGSIWVEAYPSRRAKIRLGTASTVVLFAKTVLSLTTVDEGKTTVGDVQRGLLAGVARTLRFGDLPQKAASTPIAKKAWGRLPWM
jgi:hypothetical protein